MVWLLSELFVTLHYWNSQKWFILGILSLDFFLSCSYFWWIFSLHVLMKLLKSSYQIVFIKKRDGLRLSYQLSGHLSPGSMIQTTQLVNQHCLKSVQIPFFSGPYFPLFRPNTGKYVPQKTLYLDNFHAVQLLTQYQSKRYLNDYSFFVSLRYMIFGLKCFEKDW